MEIELIQSFGFAEQPTLNRTPKPDKKIKNPRGKRESVRALFFRWLAVIGMIETFRCQESFSDKQFHGRGGLKFSRANADRI